MIDDLSRARSICESFEQLQRVMWSSMWPMGHCAVSSLLLAPVLRASLERDFRVVVGYCDETDTHRGGAHAWVRDRRLGIFDPTYGQFSRLEPLRLPALGIWSSGEPRPHVVVHVLELDREEDMRRSIKPRSEPDGWSATSGVFEMFREINDMIYGHE